MLHFIALAWPTDKSIQSEVAKRLAGAIQMQRPPWNVVLRQPGLTVFYSGESVKSDVHTLAENQGVILGTVFKARSKTEPSRLVSAPFGPEQSRQLIRSEGQTLIEHYWGSYIAILRKDVAAEPIIARGPATPIPCLHLQVDGVQIYFSEMESIARLPSIELSVDWPFVVRSLLGPMPVGRTGLREVYELPPGHRQRMGGTAFAPEKLWHPIREDRASELTVFDEAAAALREATEDCMQAWVTRYRTVLHHLSGGLDSSIVLGCLAKAASPSQLTCLTHFLEASDADEREYARLATQQAGCELIEHARSPTVNLQEAFGSTRMEVNTGLRVASIDRLGPDLASKLGAAAITWGHGGDELFCRHHLWLYVADFVRRHGMGAGLRELVEHAAVMEAKTGWTVLARAIGTAVRPKRWSLTQILEDDLQGSCLIHAEVLRDLQATSIKKDRPAREPSVPPGRAWQMSLTTARRPYAGPFAHGGDAPNLNPLLSQPIIETCLRMPTWLHMQGRRDRALARAAFVRVVPPHTLSRRAKGGAEDLSARILAGNLRFVRSVLLDGRLAHEHLIDRHLVESALRAVPSGATKGTAPILELLGVEAWLHAWDLHRHSAGVSEASNVEEPVS